jgi:hypothetical protein
MNGASVFEFVPECVASMATAGVLAVAVAVAMAMAALCVSVGAVPVRRMSRIGSAPEDALNVTQLITYMGAPLCARVRIDCAEQRTDMYAMVMCVCVCVYGRGAQAIRQRSIM